MKMISSNVKCKIMRILLVILIISIVKIGVCVALREYKNHTFISLYETDKLHNLHIDRRIHFLSFEYGIIGISYHYTSDAYAHSDPTRYIGTDDLGIFRISLLHNGYIQKNWPISVYTDYDIIMGASGNS